ncbi:hypothetical protein I3842_09G176300 [Carya illinoinensis]|uniref:Synaptotagmin-3 n=1 Tax=Carya illinoinensis TaxID=32201 RepID=A0A922J9Q1_CARIL|nr:hypothetical protein I3842_09G176300 [Carya illinoinensis]
MGFVGSLLGIIGFAIGIPVGLLLGFFLFIYAEPADVEDPIVRPIDEFDTSSLLDILPEIPLWIDWLNRMISYMWPYLNKAISGIIRSTTEPMFSKYTDTFQIKSVEFKSLSLGTLPPTFHGIKVHETNENELVFEPAVRWAGNPNVTLVFQLLSLEITLQLVDIQIFAAPRVVLKPLVPTFPCFGSIVVSLMEKPHVDFGLNFLGGDIMAIPSLYQYIQDTIRRQVASLYLWPQTFEIQILAGSVGTMKKPVGILQVKVVRALNLLKMDLLGTSDPYVKLSLSGDRLPSKKTSIKMKNLNPEWNEDFKLTVKDPQCQVLQLHVYDWEKLIKKTRDPCWNEEFQFVLEQAPLKEKIHIEVMSKRTGFCLHRGESLGHVDINLDDVVYNGRINEKYNLINSRNGVIHVEIRWRVI